MTDRVRPRSAATGTPPATPSLEARDLVAEDASAAEVLAETRTGAVGRPRFAHASEAELARILDFYEVRWEYEPHVFPILWNLDGTVLESFTPDFYLPDFDLYLELTTLRQRLVRKKNRKLRRLRELYPDVRIKLFYARDFRALLLKYGRLAVVEELSGALGQAVPEAEPGGSLLVAEASRPSRRPTEMSRTVGAAGTAADAVGPGRRAARGRRAAVGLAPATVDSEP